MRNILLLSLLVIYFVASQGQEGMGQLSQIRLLKETCPSGGVYVGEFPGLRAVTKPLDHPCSGSGSLVK